MSDSASAPPPASAPARSARTAASGSLGRLPAVWRALAWTIVAVWLVVAAFPIFWLLVMSFKLPLDAFAPNPFTVVFGPATSARVGGLSVVGIVVALAFAALLALLWASRRAWLGIRAGDTESGPGRRIGFYVTFTLAAVLAFGLLTPLLARGLEALLAGAPALTRPVLGLTLQHFRAVWIENAFYRQFLNSMFVTAGVVTISLSIGALAAYALARTRSSLAFWLLIAALVFRALPHSTLVTGYLPPFLEFGLYGKRVAVIVVLVAINQPFTIWMLRSFFMNIPPSLDEAALVDGCNRLQAFWKVIMPIMWPGVITTGLFSFMLAYNDFLVAALLLDGSRQTMVPAIMQYFNRETTLTDQLEAIAAAVSITGPLLLLVLFFQRQIVSGLTSGAVKG